MMNKRFLLVFLMCTKILAADDLASVDGAKSKNATFIEKTKTLDGDASNGTLDKDGKSADKIDLDKINRTGDKQLEYLQDVETSLTCLEEQLQRLSAEVKTLRQHIDHLKFVTKNQIPSKDVPLFRHEEVKTDQADKPDIQLLETKKILDDLHHDVTDEGKKQEEREKIQKSIL